MLTPTQQRAVDRFAKSLSTLGDNALIDTYHQAWEDHRDARAEGSDNLGKAGAESLNQFVPSVAVVPALIAAAGEPACASPNFSRPTSTTRAPRPMSSNRSPRSATGFDWFVTG